MIVRRALLGGVAALAAASAHADAAPLVLGVSVLFGSVQFDPETRRVRHPASIDLVVRGGAFALWDGKPATQG